MAFLPEVVMAKYKAETTPKLMRARKTVLISLVVLGVAAMAMLAMRITIGFDISVFIYLFVAALGWIGFATHHGMGEVLAERQNGSGGA